MSGIVTELSETALVRSVEANLWEQCRFYGLSSQVELHDDPDMLWYVSGIPSPVYNAVVRTQLDPAGLGRRVSEVLRRFAERGVPMMWFTGPSTQPAGLGRVLANRGLVHAPDMPGMAADLFSLDEDLPAPRGLTIELVHDMQGLEQWARTAACGFGIDRRVADAVLKFESSLGIDRDLPWRRYLGLLKGEPVATSALYLGAGVAGVDSVTTVPEERRRGLGTALTLRALRDARSLGYRVGVLQSAPMAVGVYRRLGFKQYCTIGQYVRVLEA